jgi:hypothetical protein
VDDGDYMTWRSVDGYAVGTSHLESNVPCQDRCEVGVVAGGRVAVAVLADGAGSAAHAERGAELVCAALMGAITNDVEGTYDLASISDVTVRSWLADARAHIAADAAQNERDLRDYAATALACVAGENHTICVQLGDGGIVVRPAGDAFAVAIWPENGEYANQTFFVTDDDAFERLTIARFGRVDDVVVFSDGLSRLALDHASRTAYPPFFEPLTRTVRESDRSRAQLCTDHHTYLGSGPINARTDDDKAIAIATRLTPR